MARFAQQAFEKLIRPGWSDALLMALSSTTTIDGVWVGASGDGEAELLQKACEALEIIKRYDFHRYKRLLSDIRSIKVCLLPGNTARYLQKTSSCEISHVFVTSAHPVLIASVIVHEATHARLRRFGYDEPLRYRLEKICRAEQYRFATKHPGGRIVQAWLDSFPTLQPERLTDEAIATSRRPALAKAAYELGIPSWLVRVGLKIYDVRLARALKSKRKRWRASR